MKKLIICAALLSISATPYKTITQESVENIKCMRLEGFPDDEYERILKRAQERFREKPSTLIYAVETNMRDYLDLQDLNKFNIELKSNKNRAD